MIKRESAVVEEVRLSAMTARPTSGALMNETFIRHEPINVNLIPITQQNKNFDLIKRELSLMSFDFESEASISYA